MGIERDTQNEKRDIRERDTLARARPLRGNVTVSQRDTSGRDVTSHRDSDTPPASLRGVTITLSGGGASHAERTAAHRAKLATDPRFAGWINLMSDGDPDPAIGLEVLRRREEQDELKRAAYQRAIDRHEQGQHVDPEHLAEARAFCDAHPRLQRALGTGEPR